MEGAQTGVMGFAFHPEFGNGSDQVFVYHSYEDEERTDPTRPDEADPYHRLFNKIVRLDYDADSGELSNPTDILTGIPSNNDHNSGWPHVAGYQDDHFYVYARWADATEPCDELQAIGPSQDLPDSVPQTLESEWQTPDNYAAPIATLFTVAEAPPGCENFGYFCRPSMGPSAIAYYDSDAVPELAGRRSEGAR